MCHFEQTETHFDEPVCHFSQPTAYFKLSVGYFEVSVAHFEQLTAHFYSTILNFTSKNARSSLSKDAFWLKILGFNKHLFHAHNSRFTIYDLQ